MCSSDLRYRVADAGDGERVNAQERLLASYTGIPLPTDEPALQHS